MLAGYHVWSWIEQNACGFCIKVLLPLFVPSALSQDEEPVQNLVQCCPTQNYSPQRGNLILFSCPPHPWKHPGS